jgi:hypothetical protein
MASLSLAMTGNLRLHRPGNISQMDRNSTDRDKNRFHTAE